MIGYLHLPERARKARATLHASLRLATAREILMGAQDNLTNVLAVVLGVTIGSGRADFIALAGLSAGIAEAISMGGVLYNATLAEARVAHTRNERRLAPAMSGLVTFAAALVAGLVPLVPFSSCRSRRLCSSHSGRRVPACSCSARSPDASPATRGSARACASCSWPVWPRPPRR